MERHSHRPAGRSGSIRKAGPCYELSTWQTDSPLRVGEPFLPHASFVQPELSLPLRSRSFCITGLLTITDEDSCLHLVISFCSVHQRTHSVPYSFSEHASAHVLTSASPSFVRRLPAAPSKVGGPSQPQRPRRTLLQRPPPSQCEGSRVPFCEREPKTNNGSGTCTLPRQATQWNPTTTAARAKEGRLHEACAGAAGPNPSSVLGGKWPKMCGTATHRTTDVWQDGAARGRSRLARSPSQVWEALLSFSLDPGPYWRRRHNFVQPHLQRYTRQHGL